MIVNSETIAFDTAALVMADIADLPNPTIEDVRRSARQYPITEAECRRVVALLTGVIDGAATD